MARICYIYVLSHLSMPQKAVQSSHVVAELVNSASGDSDWFSCEIKKWASMEKTIHLYEAGNYAGLLEKINIISAGASGVPFAVFTEDEATLHSMKTAVAFVADLSDAHGPSAAIRELVEKSYFVR